MSFEHPLLLLLLPLAGLPFLAVRWGRLPRLTLPRALRRDPRTWRARLIRLIPAAASTALGLGVLAAAGPYFGARRVQDRERARDIVLVVDASESMRAVDFALRGEPASRMDAALHYAARFIEERSGDRIGVVAFGGRAVTQCPLTFDRGVARRLLAYVEPEMLGARTALGEAIALGTLRLPDGGAMVLMTDGENTAGGVTPGEAARVAAARGVRVYAVGIGSEGPAPVPARLPSGRIRMQMKDYPLQEEALRRLAATGKGRYFRATDSDALAGVFGEIDRLEAREVSADRVIPIESVSHLFAAAAGTLAVVVLLASATLGRTAPRLR